MIEDPASLPPTRQLEPERLASWRARLIREVDDPAPKRRGTRRAYAVLAAAVALVAVIATPSVGAGQLISGLFQGSDGPDSSQALALVSTPSGPNEVATLWQVPTKQGGRCDFVVFADLSTATAPPASANGGAECSPTLASAHATDAAAPPVGVTFSWTRNPDGSVTTLVIGAARPSSHVARIELKSAAGVAVVPFAHGHYLLSLPGSVEVGQLPTAAGPLSMIAYDAKGAVVVALDLNQLAGERPQ
jgi:hypothetical protein